MKIVSRPLAVLILSAPTWSANATIVNGSFESGDLAGWTWTASGGYYERKSDSSMSGWVRAPYPYDPQSNPFFETHQPEVIGATRIIGNSLPVTYVDVAPVGGDFMLSTYLFNNPTVSYDEFTAPDGTLWRFRPMYYTLSAMQNLTLQAGQTVSGWARFATVDYAPYGEDFAAVQIGSSTVWRNGVSGTGHDWRVGDWQQWQWVAPSDGTFVLSLDVYGDEQEDSRAFFDDIRVSAVPEPSIFTVGALSLLPFGASLLRSLRKVGKQRSAQSRHCSTVADQQPKPFVWSQNADMVLAKVNRCQEAPVTPQ